MIKLQRTGIPTHINFPRPHVDGSPLDFSFSGLKTSVINLIHNAEQKGETVSVPDVGASFLKAVWILWKTMSEKPLTLPDTTSLF